MRCQNENRTNFADAFGLTVLSNTARARATEIELQVQQEMAEEQNASVEESRRRRNVSEVIVRHRGERNRDARDRDYGDWLREQIGNGRKNKGIFIL